MSHLDILDITVKILRKGIGSATGNKPSGGEVTASTTAVLGAAKLGTMKLGET